MSACKVFRKLAAKVWGETAQALEAGFVLQEETITEMLLLRLFQKLPKSHFDFHAYTKPQEGKGTAGNPPTGADFLLCVSDFTGQNIVLQVQAKRQFPNGIYEGLDGNGSQLKHLVTNCGAAFPIYVFYNVGGVFPNALFPSIYPTSWGFKAPSYWGCTYALPIDVVGKYKPKPADFAPHAMFPWHCLVCGCFATPMVNPKNALLPEVLKEALRISVLSRIASADPVDGISDELGQRLTRLPEIASELPGWTDRLDHKQMERDPELDVYLEENNLRAIVHLKQTRRYGERVE